MSSAERSRLLAGDADRSRWPSAVAHQGHEQHAAKAAQPRDFPQWRGLVSVSPNLRDLRPRSSGAAAEFPTQRRGNDALQCGVGLAGWSG